MVSRARVYICSRYSRLFCGVFHLLLSPIVSYCYLKPNKEVLISGGFLVALCSRQRYISNQIRVEAAHGFTKIAL